MTVQPPNITSAQEEGLQTAQPATPVTQQEGELNSPPNSAAAQGSTAYFSSDSRRNLLKIAEKLLLWLIFNVGIALAPFAFRAMSTSIAKKPIKFEDILADGEFLLVTAAIAAGAVGELFVTQKKYTHQKLLSGGACVLSLMLSSLLYAHIKAAANPKIMDDTVIFNYSIVLFCSTIMSGGACIILSGIAND